MLTKKKILVVEDNQINRTMLNEILSAEYTVLEAENGQEALDILKEHSEEISLILLDIVMPVMDGYTFLSVMKGEPAYTSIPVIVTTQSESESDEVTALSHGATDFVAKPYKPQVILHRVASIISLRETAAMINLIQYDRLTGLYNKEFFYQRVRTILSQHPEQEYDIICSDIENFKLVNDIFGTPAGDRLLCEVANLYTEIGGDKGFYGRLNADQFACLMERCPKYSQEEFMKINLRINTLSNAKSVVTKWGIYPIEDRSISVEQMCDRALLAARSIKGQYGKYYATYDDKLRSKLLREQAIIDSMETALAEGQFLIYFQPKYRIKDDQLTGAEALIRWKHPKWGFQSPGEFIPLFEKNGFITKLDQFVWEGTCAILEEWEKKGYPPIPVSVNVSRADIYNADIAKTLTKLVEKYNLPPSRLHLEITESAYTENPDQIIETVRLLRELGFIIEMDDFGSGYSSLNMLNKMPLDILKLDMKFIQSETAKPIDQGILSFIMDLARLMNLGVVAEGVETREQLDRLLEAGCDYVQGYFFAKPMPCQEFETLIKEQQVAAEQERKSQHRQEGKQRYMLLVADEDQEYCKQVRKTFENKFEVLEAPDVKTTLEYVAAYRNRIVVLILSLSLPEPDGFAVLRMLQREKMVWNIPVVATAFPDKLLEERALESGAADFTCKPHTQKSLWKRVLHAVKLASLQKQQRILQEEVYQDYLTGLLNRRGFQAAVDSLRREDSPLAFYLFDLNNLKHINDTLGHKAGDELLREFGTILHSRARETDILCRIGGDEFAAVIRQMKSGDTALKKGREICREFQKKCIEKNRSIDVSVGIVMWYEGETLENTIARAEEALCLAKSGGEERCCLWKEEAEE